VQTVVELFAVRHKAFIRTRSSVAEGFSVSLYFDAIGAQDTTAIIDFLASSVWKPIDINPGRHQASARDDYGTEPSFRLQISTASADHEQAQQEGIDFLRKHRDELSRLKAIPGGVFLHMTLVTYKPADVLTWGVGIPLELCRLVAELEIHLSISCDPRQPEAIGL
jgi:hypothetical protein